MESLRDNRRAGASVGCVAQVFETLGDAKSNHTAGYCTHQRHPELLAVAYSVAVFRRENLMMALGCLNLFYRSV